MIQYFSNGTKEEPKETRIDDDDDDDEDEVYNVIFS